MGISVFHILMLFIILPVYFLPTIIALFRNHPHKLYIILINIFGGLVGGIGWLIALIWSIIKPEDNENDITKKIENLHQLLEKGALSKEEFELQKKALLKM